MRTTLAISKVFFLTRLESDQSEVEKRHYKLQNPIDQFDFSSKDIIFYEKRFENKSRNQEQRRKLIPIY